MSNFFVKKSDKMDKDAVVNITATPQAKAVMAKLFKSSGVQADPMEFLKEAVDNLITLICPIPEGLAIHTASKVLNIVFSGVSKQGTLAECLTNSKGYTVTMYVKHAYSVASIIRSLAHELIHVEQRSTKRLVSNLVSSSVWNDKPMDKLNLTNVISKKYVAYLNKPWEIETHYNQARLALMALNALLACYVVPEAEINELKQELVLNGERFGVDIANYA